MAAAHASASLWKKAFPSSPLYRGRMAAFGQVVWFKAKTYKGKKEREMDVVENKGLPRRWKKAYYKGPSMEVPEGHLLLREDGGLTIAKGLKLDVEEPHLEEPPILPELEAEEVEDGDPGTACRRLRGKS